MMPTCPSWKIGANELFYFYTCKRWLYFHMRNQTQYDPQRERAIEEDRILELKRYLGTYSYIDMGWDEDKTHKALRRRQSVIRPQLTWIHGKIHMEATPHALLWGFRVLERDEYSQIMVRFSRKNLPRHRMLASWNRYILKMNQIPIEPKNLFYFQDSIESIAPAEDISAFLDQMASLLEMEVPPHRNGSIRFCHLCPYEKACLAEGMERIHLASPKELRGVGEKMASSLEEKQIYTIHDVSRMEITEEIKKEHRGIERVKAQSFAFLRNEAMFFDDPRMMIPNDGKPGLFFDIEADQYPYLFGVYDQKENQYHSFLAQEESELIELGKQVIRYFHQSQATVYHYYDYETRIMRHMEELCGISMEGIAFFDVYECLRRCVILPLKTYSLKSVSKWLDFVWRMPLDGKGSIVEFRRWKNTGNPMHLESIIQYNEDDCRSTALVKDWLENPDQFRQEFRRVSEQDLELLLSNLEPVFPERVKSDGRKEVIEWKKP